MADRLLREVTREEWKALPVERSYGKADEDGGVTRYFEILNSQEPTPAQALRDFLGAHDERCESELIECVGYSPCDCDRRRWDDLEDVQRAGVVAPEHLLGRDHMPTAPEGYAACRAHDGTQSLLALGASRQVTHLVALDDKGSNGGRPTVCGLDRFDIRSKDDGTVFRPADLPGWGMGGGTSGPSVTQTICPVCYRRARR